MSIRKKAVVVVLLGLAATFTAKPTEVNAADFSFSTTYCGVSCWDLLWNCLGQGCGNTKCLDQNCEGVNGTTYGYEMSCQQPYEE